ncbi:MAG: hypothetical protein H6Q82_2003 [Deltaproteobacteria bacterium]|nr:hypothetical protein [Deltaproteobacteria bacterium]MBP2686226.1 hypothetical protein [Deltaproteobacteria bacterium]
MNRKNPAGLAAVALLIVSLCLVGSGNARRKGISPTRRVVVDGRSFVPDESAPDDGSLLKRELGRLGVRIPGGFDLPEETAPSHPVFAGRLKDPDRPPAVEAPRLPAGLTAEHTLRMEGEAAPVDLVFGMLGTPGSSIRSRLLASGWTSLPTGKDPGGTRVLQFTPGKETLIVFLDEAEGTFLLFREVGR